MDTIETINSHRSIRRYKMDVVPDEVLETILHAATRASSSGNMQTYSVIVTGDSERREKLWSMHFEQDMVLEAPVILTFCVDWNRMNRWCRIRKAEPGFDNFLCFLVGFADALIAAQNAALAAESLGLGICYMGTTLNSAGDLIDFFELPEGVFPATSLVVGIPDEDPGPRSRLPLDSIVHRERYQDFDEDRIDETYRDRDVEGWKRYMEIPRLAERIRRSGVANLAHIYTELKYARGENMRSSQELLDRLERQGFMRNG
jgi:nitroreductase